MARLIVVGDIHVEISVPPHEIPSAGGICSVPPITLQVCGSAANTAITAARLGVSTAYSGTAGDDIFGQLIRDRLAEERVDISRLQVLSGRDSPTAVVLEGTRGPRATMVHEGTHADCHLPELIFNAPCRVFHFAAPERMTAIWPRVATEFIRRLKVARRTVSLDPFVAANPSNSKRLKQEYQHLLELVDIVFPNEEEARLISGRRELKSVIRYFHERGVAIVVVKRGESGAVVSWEGRVVNARTNGVEVVDSSGAGDNFVAGFLAGHLRGLDPVECARFGCALGTLTVSHKGALAATEDSERLEKIVSGLEKTR